MDLIFDDKAFPAANPIQLAQSIATAIRSQPHTRASSPSSQCKSSHRTKLAPSDIKVLESFFVRHSQRPSYEQHAALGAAIGNSTFDMKRCRTWYMHALFDGL